MKRKRLTLLDRIDQDLNRIANYIIRDMNGERNCMAVGKNEFYMEEENCGEYIMFFIVRYFDGEERGRANLKYVEDWNWYVPPREEE